MAVGLGASYPNLRESDPSKIVAGFGGTLSLVAGLLFLTVMLILAGVLTQLFFRPLWGAGGLWSAVGLGALGGVLVIGVGVAAAPMVVGIRRFERMEF